MKPFRLPDLGEGLSDAEIREWHVKQGDVIAIDDPLISMETAKAVVEVPSPMAGKIKACHGNPGDVIKTGEILVEFEDASQQVILSDQAAANSQKAEPDQGTVVGKVRASETIIDEPAAGVIPTSSYYVNHPKASPAIRMLAAKLNLDLSTVNGTGPNGIITRADCETAVTQQSKSLVSDDAHSYTERLSAVDKFMFEAMTKSHREVVPVTVIDDADISHWGKHEDVTVRMIQAIVKASQHEPHLNAQFDSQQLTRTLYDHVHCGLALDTEEGLFVPVIRHAESLGAEECREQIDDFKARAKARTLKPEEMQGATITLSNFGSIGGRYANPIVIPPSVAIIGVGHHYLRSFTPFTTTAEHCMLPLSLTFDHRAVTGGQASRFIAAMIKALRARE